MRRRTIRLRARADGSVGETDEPRARPRGNYDDYRPRERVRVLLGLDWLWYATVVCAGGNNSVVECDLAKVEVAGSNPVSRSNFRSDVFESCERQVGKPKRRLSRRSSRSERRGTALPHDLPPDESDIGAVAKW